jgi:predicted protein tyrosine phosphatase
LGFSAVTKNRCADNFSKRRRKLSEFEPSLRQKREILLSIKEGFAFSLPDRWQALKAGACRATAARLRP